MLTDVLAASLVHARYFDGKKTREGGPDELSINTLFSPEARRHPTMKTKSHSVF